MTTTDITWRCIKKSCGFCLSDISQQRELSLRIVGIDTPPPIIISVVIAHWSRCVSTADYVCQAHLFDDQKLPKAEKVRPLIDERTRTRQLPRVSTNAEDFSQTKVGGCTISDRPRENTATK
ncbi:hypothetical protein KIN20_024848 [Parelaphostrongylus tenuis]|uniref:Uncharacterized protein n=1 Tax=Parelaphostrongylus tenuis TaxID=148309 RepID=A0AAD5MXJ7_PARTN|nr:hypothetical protein KIN20_024848 [Parelaphostrongylus tenuis]